MILGWRNNPAWVAHYERVKKERVERRMQLQQAAHQQMMSELNLVGVLGPKRY